MTDKKEDPIIITITGPDGEFFPGKGNHHVLHVVPFIAVGTGDSLCRERIRRACVHS